MRTHKESTKSQESKGLSGNLLRDQRIVPHSLGLLAGNHQPSGRQTKDNRDNCKKTAGSVQKRTISFPPSTVSLLTSARPLHPLQAGDCLVDDSETAHTGGRWEVTQASERGWCWTCLASARGAKSRETIPALPLSGVTAFERLRSWKTREFKSNRMTVTSYDYGEFAEHDGGVARGVREC